MSHEALSKFDIDLNEWREVRRAGTECVMWVGVGAPRAKFVALD